MVAAHGARAFFPFAHVIDCELLLFLWMQPCQKLLAGMVICGSGPNLTAGLDHPQFVPGFPDPDLFDHFAHSGRRSCLVDRDGSRGRREPLPAMNGVAGSGGGRIVSSLVLKDRE